MTEAAAAQGGQEPLVIGRYALFDALASGGMATIHLGRLLGAVGFGRTVAVKRLHSHYASDQEFVAMFMDEARIVSRIRHPNVVPMIDVIESSQGLFLVMEYVHGESLSKILRTARAESKLIPIDVVSAIFHGVLLGLHAAHETKGYNGELLDVVHRDVSPQNIMVGADGVPRVLDFGVAKAAGRAQVTRDGQIKGKLTYMAPEQIRGNADRRADIFAASVILWEALAGRRLHDGAQDVEIVTRVVKGGFPPPSKFRPEISPELDAIVLRGLAIDRDERYATAREMAIDLERTVGLASPSVVGEWVERLASEALRERSQMIAAMEESSDALVPAESRPPPPMPNSLGAVRTEGVDARGDRAHPPEGVRPLATPDSVSITSGTPAGTEMPAELVHRDPAPTIAVLSFCAVLALLGFALGGFSLYARWTAQDPAPPHVPAAPEPTTPSASSASPAAFEKPILPPASSSAAPAPEPSAAAAPPPAPSSSVRAPAANAGAGAPRTRRPPRPATPTQQAATPRSASAKKDCPPFTVDEAGHRRYNLECLGSE